MNLFVLHCRMFLFLFGVVVDDRKCLSMGLCVCMRWEVLHSIKKLQIISFFNHQALKPPRFPWNLPGWGYLDINVFVPSQNSISSSELPRICCVRQHLLSLAACGKVGSDPGCASSPVYDVEHFHTGGEDETLLLCKPSEVYRWKLRRDLYYWLPPVMLSI